MNRSAYRRPRILLTVHLPLVLGGFPLPMPLEEIRYWAYQIQEISFIQEMRAYAVARNPNFLIIQQNAASLIDGHPELTVVIDAIAQEAVWYD